VSRYPLNRQESLRRARDRVTAQGSLLPIYALVENFLKYEVSTRGTDPRNISPRSDEFLSIIGPYISSVEHALLKSKFLVKGLSLDARHQKMHTMLFFGEFIETDYSRFDMTISEDMLKHFEYRVLTTPFPGEDHELFRECLRATWRTSGKNEFELFYRTIGGRCSGDAHTSISNGLLNHFMTWASLENCGFEYVSFHEGDDGIIAVPAGRSKDAMALLSVISTLGFKIKSVVSPNLHETTFCGRYMFEEAGAVRSIADVPRTLGKFNITLRQGDVLTLLCAKAMSYAQTDIDTPIIGPLVHCILELYWHRLSRSGQKRAKKLAIAERYVLRGETLAGKWRSPSVSNTARCVVADRSGYSVSEQLRMEKEIKMWMADGCLPCRVSVLHTEDIALDFPDRDVVVPDDYIEHMQ